MKDINLPQLKGSEKQIALAEKIRSALFNTYSSIESDIIATNQNGAVLQPYRAMFESIESASYYIDNRVNGNDKLSFIEFVKSFIAYSQEKGIAHLDREKMEIHYDTI